MTERALPPELLVYVTNGIVLNRGSILSDVTIGVNKFPEAVVEDIEYHEPRDSNLGWNNLLFPENSWPHPSPPGIEVTVKLKIRSRVSNV